MGASAIGTIGSAAAQSGAASDATKAAEQANAQNLAFEKGIYNTATTNLNPTIQEGQQAGNALAGLLGTGGNPAASQQAFQNYLGSTNYQFQLGQGENAVEYANAPAFSSGATAKALNNYAQGQAGSALQGYEGLLQNQQGLGVQGASALAGVGTNVGNTSAASNSGAAGVAGSSAIYGANANQNALAGLAQLVNQQATQSSFGTGTTNLTAPAFAI